jgi:hypothetical protein
LPHLCQVNNHEYKCAKYGTITFSECYSENRE